MTALATIPGIGEDAELATLASVVLNSDAADVALTQLTAEMFASHAHQSIFLAMQALRAAGSPIDRVAIRRQCELLGREVPVETLVALTSMQPVITNIATYADLVRDSWMRRAGVAAAGDLRRDLITGEEPTPLVLARYASGLRDLAGGDPAPARHWVHRAMDREDALLDRSTTGRATWPVRELTDYLGPWLGDQLCIVGGMTSHGKTWLACQVALCAAKQGVATRVYSLEMEVARVASRLNWIHTGINPANLTDAQRPLWTQGYDDLHNLPLEVIDDEQFKDFDRLLLDIERAVRREGTRLVVIDYLLLLAKTGYDQRDLTAMIRAITRSLKSVVKRSGVDVVLLHQINKSVGSNRRRPQVGDLEYGGEKDADSVVIVNQPGRYLTRADFRGKDAAEQYKRAVPYRLYTEAIVGKNRNGKCGIVKLGFDDVLGVFRPHDDTNAQMEMD